MLSDDTEHACMTAQALLVSDRDAAGFARSLAWRLRLWLLGLPAGIGRATLRSILKLWLGFSPDRSGVLSAGNGPAMRAAVLGACLGATPESLREFVRRSTRITHTDPRAEDGALAVALAAQFAVARGVDRLNPADLLGVLRQEVAGDELRRAINAMETALRSGAAPAEFADQLGLSRGVTGYVNHTVPVALYCWLHSPADFRTAVEDVILLGGDTDSSAAIVGALAGAAVGASAIPDDWLAGMWEWPRSVQWLRRLAGRLEQAFFSSDSPVPGNPLALFWPGLILRNVLFLAIVLLHGLRRLLPPY